MTFLAPLYEKAEGMWVGFVKLLPLLGIAFVALVITWIIAKVAVTILKKSLERSNVRESLRELFGTLIKVFVWSVGVLIAITIVFPSLTPAKLLTALGLGSVAIGLAFKDIFENFFAGILIMLRKPMRIGDFVECEGVSGKVEHISIRETYLRKTDDQLVLLPNSYLFKNPVHVLTDKNLRRFDIVVGVGYGENVDEAREVIQNALANIKEVEDDKPQEVYACGFNSSSIDFNVRWWTQSSPIDEHKSRDKIISSIKKALDDANIEIPFPHRTLTFSEPLTVSSQQKNSDE